MIRQGDILLKPVNVVADWKPEGAVVLAQGSATGHAHFFKKAQHSDCGRYVRLAKDGKLLHGTFPTGAQPDHSPIKVAAGTYEVIRQHTFDTSIRMVQD